MQELKNSADLVQYLRNNPTSDAMRAAADRIEELEAQLKRGGDQNGSRAAFEAWHKREMWDGSYDEVHAYFEPDAYLIDAAGYYERKYTQIAWRGYQAALASPEVQALRDALKVANDALEEISNEMTVGDRWTNAGQSLLDALPVTRAALAQEREDSDDIR